MHSPRLSYLGTTSALARCPLKFSAPQETLNSNARRFSTDPDMARPIKQKYKISETFNAPLDYVFAWCTDFREDDNRYTGSKTVRKILEKDAERVIWRVRYKEGKGFTEGVRAVWLSPPRSWHLDTCGDGREVGDYKLTPLGKSKTRLDMKFVVTYDSKDEVEDKDEWEADGVKHWKLYKKALEADFKAGRPAR